MKRIHLFEFEDQSWFPVTIRNYGTDFLQFISNKTKLFNPVIPLLTEVLKETNTNNILDLGSGVGGGLLWLNSQLIKSIPDLQITLSDYFPNITAYERLKKQVPNLDYIATPVDARDVP